MMFAAQILEQALLMFPLILGIYISFAILKIADLTVDGSFLVGAAVFATLSIKGVPLLPAMILAVGSGAVAGVASAYVQRSNRLDPLIVGILMTFILHSLSLAIMERPNIGLLHNDTIFSLMKKFASAQPLVVRVLALTMIVSVLSLMLGVFLSSRHGLWLKSFGNNQILVALLGKNPERLRIAGLAIGNALAALSGCLTAQASGYADINMGFGQALIGIAVILLGKELVNFLSRSGRDNDAINIFSVFIGTLIYFGVTNELVRLGLNPVYLKMAIGGFLICFMLMTAKNDKVARVMS